MKYAGLLAISLWFIANPAFAEQSGNMHDHAARMAVHADVQSEGLSATPIEPGQGAFASIQEITTILLADPDTDWSKVRLEDLRLHLADMDNVTLRSAIVMEPLSVGARFKVSATEASEIRSIRNMVLVHGLAMSGTYGWSLQAEEGPDGAILTVTGTPGDAARIQGLGFIGIMTLGMHHQSHHLAIARGDNPH